MNLFQNDGDVLCGQRRQTLFLQFAGHFRFQPRLSFCLSIGLYNEHVHQYQMENEMGRTFNALVLCKPAKQTMLVRRSRLCPYPLFRVALDVLGNVRLVIRAKRLHQTS